MKIFQGEDLPQPIINKKDNVTTGMTKKPTSFKLQEMTKPKVSLMRLLSNNTNLDQDNVQFTHKLIRSESKNKGHLAYARFPTLSTGCKFSRARHELHVSPAGRLYLGPFSVLFSRLDTRCGVFPRFMEASCFPALGTGFMYSSP